MNIRHRVELRQSERDELKALLAGGKQSVRRLKRAQILMTADQGASAIANVSRGFTGGEARLMSRSMTRRQVGIGVFFWLPCYLRGECWSALELSSGMTIVRLLH